MLLAYFGPHLLGFGRPGRRGPLAGQGAGPVGGAALRGIHGNQGCQQVLRLHEGAMWPLLAAEVLEDLAPHISSGRWPLAGWPRRGLTPAAGARPRQTPGSRQRQPQLQRMPCTPMQQMGGDARVRCTACSSRSGRLSRSRVCTGYIHTDHFPATDNSECLTLCRKPPLPVCSWLQGFYMEFHPMHESSAGTGVQREAAPSWQGTAPECVSHTCRRRFSAAGSAGGPSSARMAHIMHAGLRNFRVKLNLGDKRRDGSQMSRPQPRVE